MDNTTVKPTLYNNMWNYHCCTFTTTN